MIATYLRFVYEIEVLIMRVLYLAPLLPASSGNGGRKAIFNHVVDLLCGDIELEAVFIDVEDDAMELPVFQRSFAQHVFRRQLPRMSAGIAGKLVGARQALFDDLPRSVAVVSSVQARNFIASCVGDASIDLIIVDHLNAYGLVRGMQRRVPLMYVAHNVESEVLRHQIDNMPGFSLSKLLRRFDHVKMVRFESELLQDADKIVLIGSGDLDFDLIKQHLPKISLWPELPDVKKLVWQYPGSRKLLFVGSPTYFPNRDAIKWLLEILMPQIYSLDPSIVLHLVGASRNAFDLAVDPPNVVFEGFVSEEKLTLLHGIADLFICPVVLGAGIKIKVLEAASFGMPVAATKESLKGIDFLDDAEFVFSRNNPATAKQIVKWLDDPALLAAVSRRGLDNLGKERTRRGALVDC